MERAIIYTDGSRILATDVHDTDGNHIPRVQEIHVIFEVLEDHPHGYLTRILQNEDGSTKTEIDENGENQICYLTEDIDRIEIRIK